jgi:hypothetical protein
VSDDELMASDALLCPLPSTPVAAVESRSRPGVLA